MPALILLLQIGTLGMGMAQNKPPVMIMDVEVLEPLRSAIRDQLRDGHVERSSTNLCHSVGVPGPVTVKRELWVCHGWLRAQKAQ